MIKSLGVKLKTRRIKSPMANQCGSTILVTHRLGLFLLGGVV